MKIIVSACLLGENCKYNGGNNYCPDVEKLYDHFDVIPVCPEVFGGLPTPRPASEIVGSMVVNTLGENVTDHFVSGADHTLYIAQEADCPFAVLKGRSPSCGCGTVYDGTFSGKLVQGNGVTAQLLLDNNIQVFTETEIDKAIMLYAE